MSSKSIDIHYLNHEPILQADTRINVLYGLYNPWKTWRRVALFRRADRQTVPDFLRDVIERIRCLSWDMHDPFYPLYFQECLHCHGSWLDHPTNIFYANPLPA